jgi:hypothetical protein
VSGSASWPTGNSLKVLNLRFRAPTDLTATPGDGNATLSWSPPASDGGSAITGYDVTWTENGHFLKDDVGATRTTVVVSGLTNQVPITFDVRATTAYKVGPQAGISATPTDEVAPLAPTNLSAAVGDGIIDLSWAEPPGGTPAANYELTYRVVEARKNGPSTSTELSQSIPPSARSEIVGSLTRLVAGTLPNGQQITFNLVAVNSYGSSSAAVVKATPGAASPSALYASGGPKKVTLSWDRRWPA